MSQSSLDNLQSPIDFIPNSDTTVKQSGPVNGQPSKEFTTNVEEDRMVSADINTLTGVDLAPDSPIDIALRKELAGHPIALKESDYIPADAIYPLYVSHHLPKVWVIVKLGAFKDAHCYEWTKLQKGSPINLIDVQLGRHSFGMQNMHLLVTISDFVEDQLGYQIA